MTDLSHLVKAVRQRLSKEDLEWLRALYDPPSPEAYDQTFDRALARMDRDASPERESRSRHS